MTKTKRQLRAEAVGRLKDYMQWHDREEVRHDSPDLLMAVIGGESWGTTWEENRDTLVALLTDGEPPEGDAASITQDWVRDLVERHSDEMGGNGRAFHNGAYRSIACEIADMVERDYARRDGCIDPSPAGLCEAVAEYAQSRCLDDSAAIDALVCLGFGEADFEEAGFGDFARAYFAGGERDGREAGAEHDGAGRSNDGARRGMLEAARRERDDCAGVTDSARAIAKELREFASTHLIALGNGQYEEYGELNDLADRIEKLAGGGE